MSNELLKETINIADAIPKSLLSPETALLIRIAVHTAIIADVLSEERKVEANDDDK